MHMANPDLKWDDAVLHHKIISPLTFCETTNSFPFFSAALRIWKWCFFSSEFQSNYEMSYGVHLWSLNSSSLFNIDYSVLKLFFWRSYHSLWNNDCYVLLVHKNLEVNTIHFYNCFDSWRTDLLILWADE